MTIGLLVVK